MKILRVISTLAAQSGGPAEGARRIDSELVNLGHSIEVVSLDSPSSAPNDYPAVVHALGPSRGGFGYASKLIPWLRANSKRFDFVIVNGIWQFHSLAVRIALKNSGVPYFLFTHGMLDPWFRYKYPLKHIKKYIYWIFSEYWNLRNARAVLFTSDEERRLAKRSFSIYSAKEKVVAYGTSGPPDSPTVLKQEFLAEYQFFRGCRIILFLGRIHEKKGCDILLDAFATIANVDPSIRLVMAGPDQMGWAAELNLRAQSLGIESQLYWTGMLSGRKKWSALCAAEVLCLPSHQENFGIVVAEALACGTPVLISNKVNIWREIDAFRAGFVDDDTTEGTIRNLHRWLSLGAPEYTSLSLRAEACFSANFQVGSAAMHIAALLD